MMRRISLGVFVVLFAALAAWKVFVFPGIEDAILFKATKTIDRDPSAMDWAFEDVWVESLDGERTHGWFVPLEGARGTVLFSHGNAGNIADRLESIGLLREFGLSVLAYDYGGYGKSSGKPSEARLYADIEAMWDWLSETKGIPPERIVVFGRSLGGGPSSHLATQVEAGGVVLESTFSSIRDAARHVLNGLPVTWLLRERFENLRKAPSFTSPLLVIHSPDDTLVPYAHGRKIFEAAPDPKTFLQIQGDHNRGFVESLPRYEAGWDAFLRETVALSTS